MVWTEYELVHYILQFFSTNLDLRIGMDGILDIEKNTMSKEKKTEFFTGDWVGIDTVKHTISSVGHIVDPLFVVFGADF